MNWPSRNFKNVFLQLTAAFGPAYLTGLISVGLAKTRLCNALSWLGRRTYCVVVFHFAALRLVYVAGVVLGRFPLEQLAQLTPMGELTAHGGWIFFAASAVLLSSLMSWLSGHCRVTDFIWNGKISRKI